jgi:hypothetical protein
MSVSDNFKTFCSNLRMSDETVRKIQSGYHQITKKITMNYRKSTLETNHSLYVGSYGRGTEISSDSIDIIVQLPYSTYMRFDNYSSNGQAALLEDVKEVLQKTISTAVIKSDGNVIGVNLISGINFRVVPVFINKDRRSFTYADAASSGDWKIIDPRSEIAEINSMNGLSNKNLKRLCRMARAWKDTCNVPMSGILIDTLAYKFIKDWEYRDKSYAYYDCMSRDFFKYLKDIDATQSFWLAPGSNRYVEKDGNFQDKASQAYDKSLEAIDNEWDDIVARQNWREIYGVKFPI